MSLTTRRTNTSSAMEEKSFFIKNITEALVVASISLWLAGNYDITNFHSSPSQMKRH